MESKEKMIEALRSIGIDVVPVMKAVIRRHIGIPERGLCSEREMSIEDAYNKYCLSQAKSIDPFVGNDKGFKSYLK